MKETGRRGSRFTPARCQRNFFFSIFILIYPFRSDHLDSLSSFWPSWFTSSFFVGSLSVDKTPVLRDPASLRTAPDRVWQCQSSLARRENPYLTLRKMAHRASTRATSPAETKKIVSSWCPKWFSSEEVNRSLNACLLFHRVESFSLWPTARWCHNWSRTMKVMMKSTSNWRRCRFLTFCKAMFSPSAY